LVFVPFSPDALSVESPEGNRLWIASGDPNDWGDFGEEFEAFPCLI
jgi:hypothetical protein